jgi:DNA-binding LacI/PurR family transcriptional regulator
MEAVPCGADLATEPEEVSRLKSAHRVNIAQVAATAGVSVGTVSRVLNESPNVREHTRRRVIEVMKRLNYRPSRAVVVSLRLSREQLGALRTSSVPLAMVDTEAPGIPCTVVDDIRGGALATEHLISLGHRRIGFVGDSPDDLGFVSTRRRLLGYRRTLSRHRLGYDQAIVRLGRHSASVAATMALELLDLPSPPTAIFAGSDTQALGVLAAAERSGYSVPGDLSVVGFDDIESAAQLGLSTVHQPLAESGAHGASRLCALIRGQLVRPLREELPLSVVARTSSAMYAVAGVA